MNDLYKALYSELERSLIRLNYEAIPSKSQFQRIGKSSHCNVILSVAGHQPVEVELFLGIRVNLVEDLVYQFTYGLKDYGPYSNTLIVPAKKVKAIKPHFYSLSTKEDVSQAKARIMLFLDRGGFSFLKKYSCISTLDELYNQYPELKSSYLKNEFHRALRGIILAKIAQRSQWQELTTEYRTKLQQRGLPGVQMQRYEQLVRFLTNYSFS